MDKKSMAIILAAMGLSAGSGLTMEKSEIPDNCAATLSSDDLNELFNGGDITMPGIVFSYKVNRHIPMIS